MQFYIVLENKLTLLVNKYVNNILQSTCEELYSKYLNTNGLLKIISAVFYF